MSSRVVRGEELAEAEPMPWLSVGTPAPARHATPFAPAPKPGEGSVEDLRARLAASDAARARAAAEAKEAGRREGEAAARESARAELEVAVRNFTAAVRQAADLKPRLRLEAESDMVRLALAIARRVVRRELSIDPEAISGLVHTGLEKLRLQETLQVRVHPDFREAVRACLARTTGAAHIEVAADATLERGAALFETSRGRLDVSAETQLNEIERGLTDRLRAHGL